MKKTVKSEVKNLTEFKSISKTFGNKKVISDFSLTLGDGEKIALMGESGYGKTTLLNIAANLLTPDSGSFSHSGKGIAYMFQEPRLLSWHSARENILAVLPGGKSDKKRHTAAEHYLRLTGLYDCADTLPDSLSGGMKQRLSYARFLAYAGMCGSDLLLLDEPFSSIDAENKSRMSELLKSEAKDKTVIYVTHNISDATDFCDRIITLK